MHMELYSDQKMNYFNRLLDEALDTLPNQLQKPGFTQIRCASHFLLLLEIEG